MLFDGEVAIITGAARGIGKCVAQRFCEEGARSVIMDIDPEKGLACASSIEKNGGEALFLQCDVTNVGRIQACLKEVADRFGRIDILVNNAGILHTTPIEEITEDEWDHMMAVNLKSVFFMSQKVIPYFRRQGSGKIVNLSSLAGRMGGITNGLGYTASKAGIIGLTHGFASRLARDNINVNAIAPGPTKTDILSAITPQRLKELEESIPLSRLGTPEEIANAVIFLASSQASFITGAVLDVNGGLHFG